MLHGTCYRLTLLALEVVGKMAADTLRSLKVQNLGKGVTEAQYVEATIIAAKYLHFSLLLYSIYLSFALVIFDKPPYF